MAMSANARDVQLDTARIAFDIRSLKCRGVVNGQRFFAKLLLADPYPINVVTPWKEIFRPSQEWRRADEQLELEWNRSCELQTKLGASCLARPLGRSLASRTLVWEQLHGKPVLDDLVFRSRVSSRAATAAAALRQAGSWLRRLHERTACGSEALEATSILNSVLQIIESEEPSAYVDRAAIVVRSSLERLRGQAICSPLALNHGDFTLANLMWSRPSGQLGVVDFENAMPVGTWRDLATMVLSLRKQLLNPVVSRRAVMEMEDAFWAGYGDVGQPMLIFVYALAISRILFYYPHRIATRGKRRGWRGAITGSLYRSLMQNSMIERSVQPRGFFKAHRQS
jgi:Phosphotransferase enzyme family